MVALAPPGRPTFITAAKESVEDGKQRYTEIAEVIRRVVQDPSEEPVLSRKFTASLLISLTFHESAGWRRDVDLDIDRLRLAGTGWQDHGRSWCMGQHNLGLKMLPGGGYDSAERTSEGWSGRDLVQDREKCIRATLHAARRSFSSTPGLPLDYRLVIYAAGNATSEDGRNKSERRIRLAKKLNNKPMPAPPAIEVAATPSGPVATLLPSP